MSMQFYIVYWYDTENKRQTGTTLVYTDSKRSAHQTIRKAFPPVGVQDPEEHAAAGSPPWLYKV